MRDVCSMNDRARQCVPCGCYLFCHAESELRELKGLLDSERESVAGLRDQLREADQVASAAAARARTLEVCRAQARNSVSG